MAPNPKLKRVDFSKAVSVGRNQLANFPEGSLTISFWIQWRHPSGDFSSSRLISYCDAMSDHAMPGPRLVVMNPNDLTIWFGGTSANTGANVGNDGKWHHIAITVKENPSPPPDQAPVGGVTVNVYRDGFEAGQAYLQTDPGEILQPNGPFSVSFPFEELQDQDGGSSGKYLEGFGSIAEIRIWNGIRTAKQIGVEMTGYLVAHPDLRLYWPVGFDANMTSVIHDASNNGNDGSFYISTHPAWNSDPLPLPAAPMDLSGVDLSGADIHGLSLAGRNLSGAILRSLSPSIATDLTGVDLSNSDLSGADLTGAKLIDVNFTGAKLHGSNFTSTDLTHAAFSTQPDWSRDDNSRTILVGATFPVAVLGRDWSHLHLTGAHVQGLDANVDLSGVNADHIIFKKAPLTRCRFHGASFKNADLTQAQLNDADLSNCSLTDVTLYGADLTGVTLSSADMRGAKLGGAGDSQNVPSAVLSYAFMPGVTLTNAEAFGVDFSYAQIYAGAKVDGAHLESCNFSNTNLCDMNFTQAHMKGVDLTGAILVRCKFNGVDLGPATGQRPASLTGASLQGADFTGATLAAANLSGSNVALTSGTISIQRIDKYGHLESAEEPYDATNLTQVQTDDYTKWPNGSSGALTDPATQLRAPDPPAPPPCVPSLTSFCPRPKRT